MMIAGSCHCGAIRYQAEVDPTRVTICHCKDCQRLTGAAYRVSVGTTREAFVLERGTPKIYVKKADSGASRAQVFCPECGSPLFTYDLADSAAYGLRVGCIDQRSELIPSKQIWCRSALPWSMDIAALPRRDAE